MEPDPVDSYLDAILNGDADSGSSETPSATASAGTSGLNTTWQDVIRVNGTVTSYTDLPQSEQASLAAVLGGPAKEPIRRYWFQNGKYVDVGVNTSAIYRGSALGTLNKSGVASKPVIITGGDKRKYEYDPTTKETNLIEDIPGAGARTATWTNPNDGSQWIINSETGDPIKQLSGAIPGYVPGRGVPAPREPKEYAPQYPNVITKGRAAYKTDPYTGAVEKVYDFPEEEPTQAELDKEQRQYDYWRERDKRSDEQKAADREDAMRRAKLTAAVDLSGSIGQQKARMLPYAVDPSWTSYPGFEAGGPVEQLYKMGGSTGYTPPQIPRYQYNPLDDWYAAQSAIPFDGNEAWRLAQQGG